MTTGIALIGSGNIALTYARMIPQFAGLKLVAVADIRPEAARTLGEAHRVAHGSPAEVLRRDDVDIAVNLTVPNAHAEVSLAALEAGKHVFSEKPLAVDPADGRAILAAAAARGLRVGCAPDTVFGPGVQRARAVIDSGEVGPILAGSAAIMSHGMEHWHPDPEFFFKPGAGPVLDLGPYYLGAMVVLLGPIAEIRATAKVGFAERLVTAEGPRKGQSVRVETPTTVHALLRFASGADIVFQASWDVWKHSLPLIELYGAKGGLRVPDPNFFGGEVGVSSGRDEWRTIGTSDTRLGIPNYPWDGPFEKANYRGLGLADMAQAIATGRPHRASGDVAQHVLEAMVGILAAAETDRPVRLESRPERPAPLSDAEAATLFAR
jgi:predicted dehydrogenase